MRENLKPMHERGPAINVIWFPHTPGMACAAFGGPPFSHRSGLGSVSDEDAVRSNND